MRNTFILLALLVSFTAEAQLIGAGRRGVSGAGTVTETDPTVPADVKSITGTDIANWRGAVFGSGNQTGLSGNKTWTGIHAFSQFVAVPGVNTGTISRNATTSPLVIQQSNTSTIIGQFHGTTGNAVFQAPGVAPSDNGNRLTVDGTSLTTGTASFTGTWANRQLFVGSTGQGGSIQINRGDTGASGLRIGMNNATNSIGEIIAGDLQIIASTQQLRLQSSHSSGSVLINTGGANTRMSINSTGQINFLNVPVFADNTAAASLLTGDVYRTATGVLMIKY